MSEYIPTIGLEIHAELKTKTKLFCDSKNDPDETRPNSNVCPVCMAHPGVLPVLNKEAVHHMLRIGAALGGTPADYTEFDRKNYFYPDIPKGYQISQYAYPLVSGGSLAGVAITRVHLEEDTARSTHDKGNFSLVDFNRAGVPLMELVTEPVIHSAEEAGIFARELQLLLRYLGAGEANMEKGEMRVEANISISNDKNSLGTKVEVKNLNSFRAVERAIAYEIKRHEVLLERGEKIVQETRGWDEGKQETFPQRLKEEAHDYRYFPDPDVPKLIISEIQEFSSERIARELPELPWQERERYIEEYGLAEDIANIFVRSQYASQFFSRAVSAVSSVEIVRSIANYIVTEIPEALENRDGAFGAMEPRALALLAEMKQRNEISSRGVKEILTIMIQEGGDPEEIAKEKGLLQQSDEAALKTIIDQIIKEHPAVVEEYRAGKDASIQFLVGQGMKITKGSANPQMLKKLLEATLMG